MDEYEEVCSVCGNEGVYFDETACSDPDHCSQWVPCYRNDCFERF